MTTRKIALVKVETDTAIHPLAHLYLGGALKKAGYEAKIFNIFADEMDGAINSILETEPLFVGFSTLTGLQTKHTYEMSMALKKKRRDIKIVWGGVHPTLLPEDCLREDCVDIVAMGEGEEAIVELANTISQEGSLKNVKNIAYKYAGEVILNSRRPFISDLDRFEPDWSLLDDFEKCVTTLPDGRRHIGFITSRGCPYNCAFCYNLKFNERRWRKHSFEYVIDKVSYLRRKHNIRALKFFDDNFFVDMERAFSILERLKEMDVIIASCMIRLNAVNEDVLKRLRRLGIMRIFVGLESGSDRILKLINKELTRDLILEKFEMLSKFQDMAVNAAFIIGFPTEEWGETCQTIDLGVKLSEKHPDIVVTFQTFLPFPGSHLYRLAMENGFTPPKNMSDYDKFDTYKGQMELTWLPWADRNTKKLFYRIDKYGKLLTHSKGSNNLRSFGKELFYYIAKMRLKNKVFAFPWEIAVLHRFNRYYNPKCPV